MSNARQLRILQLAALLGANLPQPDLSGIRQRRDTKPPQKGKLTKSEKKALKKQRQLQKLSFQANQPEELNNGN